MGLFGWYRQKLETSFLSIIGKRDHDDVRGVIKGITVHDIHSYQEINDVPSLDITFFVNDNMRYISIGFPKDCSRASSNQCAEVPL